MSDKVMDIITNITGFITYFAPGYIFISCFNYGACLQRETEKEYLIIKSISISYLFYVLISYIANNIFSLDIIETQVATFISVVLLGLMLGRVHRMEWANKISVLFFRREMTNNIFVELWENANDNNSAIYVTLTMKDNLGIYEGQLYKVTSYNSNPEILLSYYSCYDDNMHVISNYSNIDNVNLLVCYSDIQKFEFEFIPINNVEGEII